MENKISVVIPAYNVGIYIDECIKSILNQTYKNYEVIIVNDGSTDNTLKVCNKYKENANIKIITQKNKGVSIARNRGIDEATGKYIVFVDPDDIVSKYYLETLSKNVKDDNVDMVVCGYTTDISLIYKNINNSDIIKRIYTGEQFLEMLIDNNFKECYIWNKIYKKSILTNNSVYFPENISVWEDMSFLVEYIRKTNNIYIVEDKLYFYRIRENSVVNTKETLKKITDKLNVIKKIYNNVGDKNNIIKTLYCKTYLSYLFFLDKEHTILRNEKRKYLKELLIVSKNIRWNKKEKIKLLILRLKYIF